MPYQDQMQLFSSLKIVFVYANNVDHDEMWYYVAFHSFFVLVLNARVQESESIHKLAGCVDGRTSTSRTSYYLCSRR